MFDNIDGFWEKVKKFVSYLGEVRSMFIKYAKLHTAIGIFHSRKSNSILYSWTDYNNIIVAWKKN